MIIRMTSCMSDDGGDIKWLTYAELGQARGISTASATRLAFRRKWRRQGGNNRIVRVAVPADEANPQKDIIHDNMETKGDTKRLISALEAAVSTLQKQLGRENARADAAETARDALYVQLAQAEPKTGAERDRAEAAGVQTEQLKRVLREAEARLTAGDQARTEAREALQAAEEEAERLRQAMEAVATAADQARADAAEAAAAAAARHAEAERAAQAAEAEAARLREAADLATARAEQAIQEAKALREAEVARAAEAVERPTMVASRIDEVQLRRLQEAEQARKSLGRLARLKAAWRGE
jgi:chromosome segregation ATPase